MSEYIVDLTDVKKQKLSWSMEMLYDSVPVREEIVRCRDCEHFTAHDEFCADVGIGFPLIMATVDTCDLWADTKCRVEPDGFCAWGERKAEA